MIFHPVEEAFKEGVAQGVFPGAVVLVARGEEVVFESAFGFRSLVPEKTPMQVETIFDLASLTKPMATAPAIMLLVREKKIRLDDRVTRFFPNFGVYGKIYVTFRHLLAHCSGLPAAPAFVSRKKSHPTATWRWRAPWLSPSRTSSGTSAQSRCGTWVSAVARRISGPLVAGTP